MNKELYDYLSKVRLFRIAIYVEDRWVGYLIRNGQEVFELKKAHGILSHLNVLNDNEVRYEMIEV